MEFACVNYALTENRDLSNMPPYKKQHYLPTGYLKYFSSDQNTCARDSWIWRFDGKASRHVPIVSQCSQDYHYSKESPLEAEKIFHQGEALYCQCLDRIKAGKTLNGNEYGSLLVIMFDFFIRNAIHENHTDGEGIEAYKMRSKMFLREILLGKKTGEVTEREVIEHLQTNWSIRIFSSIPGRTFITSENPSVWTSLMPLRSGLHLVSLPLTPQRIAIAFDTRILRVTNDKITENDQQTLNCGQIQNARQAIYTSTPLPDEQMSIINDTWKSICRSPGEVHVTDWLLPMQGLPPEHYFSFVRLKPPLY